MLAMVGLVWSQTGFDILSTPTDAMTHPWG